MRAPCLGQPQSLKGPLAGCAVSLGSFSALTTNCKASTPGKSHSSLTCDSGEENGREARVSSHHTGPPSPTASPHLGPFRRRQHSKHSTAHTMTTQPTTVPIITVRGMTAREMLVWGSVEGKETLTMATSQLAPQAMLASPGPRPSRPAFLNLCVTTPLRVTYQISRISAIGITIYNSSNITVMKSQ